MIIEEVANLLRGSATSSMTAAGAEQMRRTDSAHSSLMSDPERAASGGAPDMLSAGSADKALPAFWGRLAHFPSAPTVLEGGGSPPPTQSS